MKDKVAARKRAYAYIKYICEDISWNKGLTIDYIAELLRVPITDLIALYDGNENPTTAIVAGVKRLFKGNPDSLVLAEIDQFLTDPFS